MKKPYYVIGILAVIIVVLLVLLLKPKPSNSPTSSTSGVMTSSASGTKSSSASAISGIMYTPASAASMIKPTSPIVNATLHPSTPVSIAGEAKGIWFFEGTFPIELTTANGAVISSGVAHATSDWATTSFVGFTGTLGYNPQPQNSKGYIVLKRDNPSGLPQNDASVKIPVIFQ